MKGLIALIVISIGLLFGLHYMIFEKSNNYLFAFLLLIPAIFVISYVIVNSINDIINNQTQHLKSVLDETMHEINLPIATIEANSKMLISSLQNQKDLKRLDRINKSAKRLRRLYNILNYNLKKDILTIDRVRIDISQIVQDRVDYFKELNRNQFILNLKPLFVTIDKIGFEQIIDNIIENAMKYSNRGDKIEIFIEQNSLIIKDYGIGIDSNSLVRIFNRYYQADSSKDGKGLGLWIVKKFCDRENIDLKIVSSPNNGTKVVLDFSKIIKIEDKKG